RRGTGRYGPARCTGSGPGSPRLTRPPAAVTPGGIVPEARRDESAAPSGPAERATPRSHEAEEEACHLPHLDLLAALGDPVAPVVPVDVLEGLVAGGAAAPPRPPPAGAPLPPPPGRPPR